MPYFCRCVAASCCFIDASPQCFSTFFYRVIVVSRLALETCLNAKTRSYCWWSNSPLSAKRSCFTPAVSQPHPSPPSGHPSPILPAVKFSPPQPAVMAVKLCPLHSAVILHPCCCRSSSPSLTSGHGGQTLRSAVILLPT